MTDSHQGLTRRQLLKRGAALGGAVAWAAPVVQVVGMRPAWAQDTSDPCKTFCIKLVIDNAYDIISGWTPQTPADWAMAWEAFKTPANDCLSCPSDVDPTVGAPSGVTGGMEVSGDPASFITISIPAGVEVVPSGDPTPDELVDGSAAVRCGNSGAFGCNYVYLSNSDGSISFTNCANERAITQIELIIRYCGPIDAVQ